MRELSVDPFLKDVTFAHPPPWPGHLGPLQARSTEVWRTPPLSLMPHLTRLPNAFWMPYFFPPSSASLRHLWAAGQDVPAQGVPDDFKSTEGGHKTSRGCVSWQSAEGGLRARSWLMNKSI